MDSYDYALVQPNPWEPVQTWDQLNLVTSINNTLDAPTINSSNLYSSNIYAYDLTASNLSSFNIYASNLTASTITSELADVTSAVIPLLSNVYLSTGTINALQISTSSNITAGFLLGMLDTPLNQPCPSNHPLWSEILREGDGGIIDNSWINYPINLYTSLQDLAAFAQAGYDLYSALKGAYDFLNPAPLVNPLDANTALADALNNALNDLGNATDSNTTKLTVGWSNVVYRPITNQGNGLVAVSSNLCFGGALTSIPNSTFLTDVWGRPSLLGTPTQTVIIDPNKNAYFNSVTCSNYVGRNGALAFNNFNASLQYVATPTTGGSNAQSAGYLQITDTTFNFLTQASNSFTPISQMQVDSTGRVLAANSLQANTLYTDQWISQSYGGNIAIGSNNLQMKFINANGSSNLSSRTSSFLTMTDLNLSFRTQPSQSNWGASNGVPPITTIMTCDSTGSLYVASNVWSQSPLLLRATLPALLDGDAVEKRISLSAAGFQLQDIETGLSNLSNVWFSVNSNGCFPLSTSNMKLMGNYETVTVPNPVFPLSNVTLSNFARLEASFSNGLVYGAGLSNANLWPSQNSFQVSRNGEIYTLQTPTGLMMQHTDSNGSFVKGPMTLCNDGSISISGQPFVLAGGSIKRASINALNNAGFLLSPTGYLTMGNLQIWPDGTINMNGKTLIDNVGRFYPRAEESGSSYRAPTAARPSGATVFSR